MGTLVVALLLFGQAPGLARRAPAELEGAWVAQDMEANGSPMPAALVEGVRFTFKGESLILAGLGGAPEQQATFVVDERTSPKRLDFSTGAGRTTYAIYEVAEGVLKLLFARGGDPSSRPTTFTTTPGASQLLIVFKKTPGVFLRKS
jgi:uncharacterized protein (TIGR03067 family)